MSVLVEGEVDACVNHLLHYAFIVEEAFGSHHGTVRYAEYLSLDDCGNRELDDLVKGHRGLVEHLRDDGHRAV